MVATAIALHLRAKSRLVSNPRFPLLFSTSSSSSTNSNVEPHDGPTSSQSQSQSQPDSASSSSSYFNDIKAKLRQPSHQQPQREQPDRHQPFPISSRGPSSPGTPNVASIEEIRRNLSEFQRRASPPPPYQSSSTTPISDPISFQGLYDRSLISKGGESIGEARMSFDSIRESLKRINKNRPAGDRTTAIQQLSKFKESFNLKPADPLARGPSSTLDRTNNLPTSVFEKEMKEQGRVESPPIKSEFMRMYSYDQLGDKLKKLRPDTKPENWFSIKELNERLVKLREMEKKETESMVSGQIYYDLKESVQKIVQEVEKKKPPSVQRLDIISHINETPFYMLKPPKEQLFEKYLHPDNMSSSELMKLELAKVRDEFKMSESDCGSARVQVAQLTTKIKHLSKVLHKKDKHSRKGLIEMVERRKKLLKYLRRTDWDSYCLVLSKLGLRDKPTEKGLIKR